MGVVENEGKYKVSGTKEDQEEERIFLHETKFKRHPKHRPNSYYSATPYR